MPKCVRCGLEFTLPIPPRTSNDPHKVKEIASSSFCALCNMIAMGALFRSQSAYYFPGMRPGYQHESTAGEVLMNPFEELAGERPMPPAPQGPQSCKECGGFIFSDGQCLSGHPAPRMPECLKCGSILAPNGNCPNMCGL